MGIRLHPPELFVSTAPRRQMTLTNDFIFSVTHARARDYERWLHCIRHFSGAYSVRRVFFLRVSAPGGEGETPLNRQGSFPGGRQLSVARIFP